MKLHYLPLARCHPWNVQGAREHLVETSDEQRLVAEDTLRDLDASGIWPGKVVTKISEAQTFWEAEAEDQNYLQPYPHGT